MDTQKSPSRALIVAGIMLVLLVLIAFLASHLTQQISRRVSTQSPNEELSRTVSPTPKEQAIYLDLPASFPRDLPLPQEAKATASREDQDQWSAVLSTVLPLEEVERFYRGELPRAGWAITSESQAAGLTTLYAKKGKMEAIIFFGKGDQGSVISITILKSS